MEQSPRFNTNEPLDFSNLSSALSAKPSKNLKTKKKRKKVRIMQGNDQKPKREKNTTTSFPLINPEPITVPIIARNADIKFINNNLLKKQKKKHKIIKKQKMKIYKWNFRRFYVQNGQLRL